MALAKLLETIRARETSISLTNAFLYSSLAVQSFPAQHCNASTHSELAADHFCGRVRSFSVEAALEGSHTTEIPLIPKVSDTTELPTHTELFIRCGFAHHGV